jgi:branched-chain amino acid aminotransferase
MSENRCDLLIYNGLEMNSSELDSSVYYSDYSIYEVVRVIDRRAIFLDDHLERLKNSVKASSKNMLLEISDINVAVNKLIGKVNLKNGNIKISFNYTSEANYSLIYFIDTLYPEPSLYESGVDTILFEAIRTRPGIKLVNYLLRSQIYDKLVMTGAYEAFLVNSENCITEGSKSNVFFIKDDIIITAPDGTVLPGITRKYIISLCKKHSIKLDCRCLKVNEIAEVESVFITGTSPKVLPVRSLDRHIFDIQNKQLRFLMSAYDDLIENYIRRERYNG